MSDRIIRWLGVAMIVGAIAAFFSHGARSTPAEPSSAHDDCVRACPQDRP